MGRVLGEERGIPIQLGDLDSLRVAGTKVRLVRGKNERQNLQVYC